MCLCTQIYTHIAQYKHAKNKIQYRLFIPILTYKVWKNKQKYPISLRTITELLSQTHLP